MFFFKKPELDTLRFSFNDRVLLKLGQSGRAKAGYLIAYSSSAQL